MSLVLALDSSQKRGVVVLFESPPAETPLKLSLNEYQILSEEEGETSTVHSEGLLSMVHSALSRAGRHISEVDVFATGIGPGSFTGLRVGIATIKGFASIYNRPVVGFSSLQVFAQGWKEYSLQRESSSLAVMTNAYQGCLFLGTMEGDRWLDKVLSLKSGASEADQEKIKIVLGHGIENYEEFIGKKTMFPNASIIRIEMNALGIVRAFFSRLKYEKSIADFSLQSLSPNYLRVSAAEAKLDNPS